MIHEPPKYEIHHHNALWNLYIAEVNINMVPSQMVGNFGKRFEFHFGLSLFDKVWEFCLVVGMHFRGWETVKFIKSY